jgi:hypothetical protein
MAYHIVTQSQPQQVATPPAGCPSFRAQAFHPQLPEGRAGGYLVYDETLGALAFVSATGTSSPWFPVGDIQVKIAGTNHDVLEICHPAAEGWLVTCHDPQAMALMRALGHQSVAVESRRLTRRESTRSLIYSALILLPLVYFLWWAWPWSVGVIVSLWLFLWWFGWF